MVLTDQQIGGQSRKLLTHFDRNGLGYTLDRESGELLVAEKSDPKVNWTSGVDMNKTSPTYGRPKVIPEYSTEKQDVNHRASARRRSVRKTSSQQPTRRIPACSMCRPTTFAWTMSRSG
jgi:glucose dehydrogenase